MQKVKQLSQRGTVTFVTALDQAAAPAAAQISSGKLRGDARDADLLLLEPTTKTRRQHYFPLSSKERVFLVTGPLCKPGNVGRQRTFQRPRENYIIVVYARHS